MKELGNTITLPANSVVSVKGHKRFNNLAILSGFHDEAAVLIEFGAVGNEAN